MKEIQKSLAIFCIATYGEGDPTDNAMDFYEWLQNGDADLEGLNYAVRILIGLFRIQIVYYYFASSNLLMECNFITTIHFCVPNIYNNNNILFIFNLCLVFP